MTAAATLNLIAALALWAARAITERCGARLERTVGR
jgi:hypothetical protein